MATITVPSEFIDLELTFGVKYERSQIVFMNGRRNWNEQMLQYCSTVFNNRLLVLFFFSPLSVQSCFLSFSSNGPSFFLPAVLTTFSLLSLLPDSVLCAVAVLSD